MAGLSSILGGMIQGFQDFGTGLVDMFGTGGAAIGDLIQSGGRSTKNQDDFRKWLYQTDNKQDAAAKGLGTILNGVQTVADVIPGAQAVTANPLFNGLQGAIAGVSDELKMAGKDVDWGRAAQRAGVGGASGLLSAAAGQKLQKTGNKLLSNGLTRGAVQGAIGGGIANAGYTGIEGGSVQDMINAGLYGAQTGALVGGTTGLARELIKPTHKMDAALTDDERRARIANIDDQLAKLDTSTPEGNARYNELMAARDNYANDKMVKLYRGMSAPDEATLQTYIDEMKNPDIAPRTYSGGSANGEGYYFTPEYSLADYYANKNNLPSKAIMEIEVPKDRFTQIDKAHNNRPADFDLAAMKRGVPEAERYATGLKDFNDYLDKNGYLGSVTDGETPTYTVMRNEAVANAKRLPTNVADLMAEKKTPTNVAELMDSNLSEGQRNYFKDSKIRDENGNLMKVYHGSNSDFTVFDSSKGGRSNELAKVGNWFTPSEEGARKFASEAWYGDGGKDRVYETYLDIKNPKVYERVNNSDAIGEINVELDKAKAQREAVYNDIMDSGSPRKLYDKNGEYAKLSSKITELENKRQDLIYEDAYEQFKSDVYAVEGKTPHQANVGGLGYGIDNGDETIKKYVDTLKAQGYDGIVIKNTGYDRNAFGGLNDQYVAFDSNQIKSTKNLNPTADADIMKSYGDYGYGGYGDTFDKTAKSIGNQDVAPIDPSTLPESNDFYKKVTEMNKNKYGYAYDAVMKDTGKSAQKITKADLETYLKDNYPDYYDVSKKYTKWELEKDITAAIEDELVDEGYENGADLGALVHNKYPRAGIRDIYIDHSGKTGRLDRELSKRLGIGESTSPLMDKLNNDTGSAAGDVNGRYLGVKHDSWTGGNGEDKLSTMGHERLHLFQNVNNSFDYEQVQPVYQELSDKLSKAMLTDEELLKVHGKNLGRGHDLDYYKRPVEQEARMLEAYLYDRGYTKGRPYRAEEFASKMNIIRPAFDKFFDKLRDLSKKGVALPALTALFGGGAIMAATQNNDKKKKSEVK